jgi:inhibitor of KinA
VDPAVRYLPSGDCALTVEFGDGIDRAVNARVMALHRALKRQRPRGVIETVPTFRSLLVHYDPLVLDLARLQEAIEALRPDEAEAAGRGRTVILPVAYGGTHGPDLEAVAAAGGIAADEAVRLHCAITHHVYMIGFAPGHPYLGDLPEALTLPRRTTPRTRLAAGTVAIAVGQTVIYPFGSPGGWHAIGRTPARLFDIGRDPPALLRAGDRVRFRPVGTEEYDALAARPSEERVEIVEDAG